LLVPAGKCGAPSTAAAQGANVFRSRRERAVDDGAAQMPTWIERGAEAEGIAKRAKASGGTRAEAVRAPQTGRANLLRRQPKDREIAV